MKTINTIELLKKAEDKYKREMSQYDWYVPSERPFRTAIKYYKRLDVFKASNVQFNPNTMIATSYEWWNMVQKIGNKLVFNSYRYSPSTSQHQSKVKKLLEQLGIKIDLEVEAPKGLQNLQSAIDHYNYEIGALKTAMANPKSRKAKNAERQRAIAQLEKAIKTVERLQAMERL